MIVGAFFLATIYDSYLKSDARKANLEQ